MRRSVLRLTALPAATAALAAVTALVAGPAQAGTGVTFTVQTGGLSIADPTTTATLTAGGSILPGSVVSGAIGSTTITDTRGLSLGWTLSMAETDFSNGTATIPASAAVVWLPAVPSTTGVSTVTNTHIAAATGLTMSNTAAAFMTDVAVGSNTATFNPSMQVTLPNTASGTYNGTFTQTVS